MKILACGVSVDQRDILGNTPLHWACAIGSVSLVERLIQIHEDSGDARTLDVNHSTRRPRIKPIDYARIPPGEKVAFPKIATRQTSDHKKIERLLMDRLGAE